MVRPQHQPDSGGEAIFRGLTKRKQEHDVLIEIARAADVRGKPLP